MAAHEEFEAFYERAYRLVVGQAFLLTGSRHEAEDIAQEALVRAASRWEQVRLYANPIAWVRRAGPGRDPEPWSAPQGADPEDRRGRS